MKINGKLIVPALLLAGLVILAGCSPAQATVDLDLIKTQAVQTVAAQATLDAVLAQPTATTPPTEAPPTETLPPAWTATLEKPTATSAPQKTNTSAPTATAKPPSSGGGGAAPTAKPPQPYDCKLVAQSPADGKLMKPAEPFDGRFTLKNTGTKTWTTDEFQFFHKSGEDFDAAADGFLIDEEVEPGDTYTMVMDMFAPFNPGIYVGWWQMRSDNNEYFCSFYVAIKVE